SLTLNADGTSIYILDNGNAAVQALREPNDFLLERFTYTISDPNGESGNAEIIIVIRGANDNPVATDDAGDATEAGGADNSQPGAGATGNVLANDSDVDLNDETAAATSVRTGAEADAGTAGVIGTELRGVYGWLTLNADGSYRYRIDDAMAAVQAL